MSLTYLSISSLKIHLLLTPTSDSRSKWACLWFHPGFHLEVWQLPWKNHITPLNLVKHKPSLKWWHPCSELSTKAFRKHWYRSSAQRNYICTRNHKSKSKWWHHIYKLPIHIHILKWHILWIRFRVFSLNYF